MVDESNKEIIVAHSMESWLPITMTWVFNQLKYGKSVHSIVLTNFTQNLELFPWSPIYQARKFNFFIFRLMRKLGFGYKRPSAIFDTSIQNHHPTILHSHFGDKGWYDLQLAKRHRLKHVVTFYGYDLSLLPSQRPKWIKRYQKLFEQADLFLCEGPYMAQSLINLGCPETKVRVLRLGVEVDKIPYTPRTIGENGQVKILIAGTFREKKGIPYALKAISKVRDVYPNLYVTIIGDTIGKEREEREKKKILDIIENYNLKPITKLLGFQPHRKLMEEAYKHHVFLSPSITATDGDTEGGAPVTIIEMAASGMPIISTNHCDIPQIINHGITGLLAEERDIDGLASHLNWLINHPDNWKQMVESARNHIEKKFNILYQTEQLAKIYKTLS